MEWITDLFQRLKWIVPGFYLALFLFFLSFNLVFKSNHSCSIGSFSINHDIIAYCFAILAIEMAEILYWRKSIFDALKVLNRRKKGDKKRNRIDELVYNHMSSWVNLQGVTILIVSISIIIIYLFNVDFLLYYADIAFLALLLYFALFVAPIFYSSWSATVKRNFEDIAHFQRNYAIFLKQFNKLECLLIMACGKAKETDTVKFLRGIEGIDQKSVSDYKHMLSFVKSVKKSGYKKGIKTQIEKVSRLRKDFVLALSQFMCQ